MLRFFRNIISSSFPTVRRTHTLEGGRSLPVRQTGREPGLELKANSLNRDPLHSPGDDHYPCTRVDCYA